MPKPLLSIDDFSAGIIDDETVQASNGFQKAVEVDIYDKPGILRPSFQLTEESTTAGLITAMDVYDGDGTEKLYGFDGERVYKRTNNIWSEDRVLSGTTALLDTPDMLTWNGSVWYATKTDIGRLNGITYDDDYLTTVLSGTLPAQDDKWKPLKPFLDKLYIGDGRYVSSLDTAGVFTAEDLTLPSGYRIKAMEVIGDRLAIAASGNSSFAGDSSASVVFMWDGVSDLFEQQINVDAVGGVQSLKNVDNILYLFARNIAPPAPAGIDIYYFNGSDFELLKTVPAAEGATDSCRMYVNAVANWNNNVLFGSSKVSGSSNQLHGVWKWGRINRNSPRSLVMENKISSGESVNISVSSIEVFDDKYFVANEQTNVDTGGVIYEVNTASSALSFTGTCRHNSCYQIDTSHYINFFLSENNDGFVQVFNVDTSTNDVTTAGPALEFDTQENSYNSCYGIDTTHFINFWAGKDDDGFVQVFEVSTSTKYDVETNSNKFEFNTQNSTFNSCCQIDTNHYINFSQGSAYIIEVDTSAQLVTTSSDKLDFDTNSGLYNECLLIDANHVINFWRDTDGDGQVQIFEVDTSTWEITTVAASLEFDTESYAFGSGYKVDDNHVIFFWDGSSGFDGFVQTFEVNTTTWAVTTAAASLEFDTQTNAYNSCYKVDTNHFINFWMGVNDDGFVQTFEVNTTTWAVTTAAASLEFDTVQAEYNGCTQVDDNHFINFWSGDSDDGYAQVFEVNTSTWSVSTAADRIEFDTSLAKYNKPQKVDDSSIINFWEADDTVGRAKVFNVDTSTWVISDKGVILEFETGSFSTYNSSCEVDTNYFLNFWQGDDSDGFVQLFKIDTSNDLYSVSTAAAWLEFDTADGEFHSCHGIDTNHFINFWQGASNDGFVQVFEVNTTTWEVTTANASLEFDTAEGQYNSCEQLDSNHFINFWEGDADDGYTQVFAVNTSTWAVSTAADRLEFDTTFGRYNSCVKVDTNHIINFWRGSGDDGYTQIFEVNTSTWEVSTVAATLEFDTANNAYNECLLIDDNHVLNFWQENDAAKAQVFEIDTSTWAITTAEDVLEYATSYSGGYLSAFQIDTGSYITFWTDTNTDGFAQTFTANIPTGVVYRVDALSTTTGNTGAYVETQQYELTQDDDKTLIKGVKVFAKPLPDGTSIDVSYSIDEASYVSLGTITSANQDDILYGIYKRGERLQVKLEMTSNGTNLPEIYKINIY